MASKSEVLPEIEALAVHCRPSLMTVEARTMWLRDWCDDLAEFPLESIQAAIRSYRHSGATKFPTPGQLLPMIRATQSTHTGPKLDVWREASPEAYRALTIREKIREHQILAHNAFCKAGPMFRNTSGGGPMSKASGTHLTLDEMPESYRSWIAEARRHTAEIERLRPYLNPDSRSVVAQ